MARTDYNLVNRFLISQSGFAQHTIGNCGGMDDVEHLCMYRTGRKSKKKKHKKSTLVSLLEGVGENERELIAQNRFTPFDWKPKSSVRTCLKICQAQGEN